MQLGQQLSPVHVGQQRDVVVPIPGDITKLPGIGQTADVCIFDPTTPWRVEAKALKSQGKNTPFLGYEMIGKVRYTLMAGHGVYEG